MRGPSFTDAGKRPERTPAHQVERLTGIGPWGARIDASRTKPVSGRCGEVVIQKLRVEEHEVLRDHVSLEGDPKTDKPNSLSAITNRFCPMLTGSAIYLVRVSTAWWPP
jgi:hypothetical protein